MRQPFLLFVCSLCILLTIAPVRASVYETVHAKDVEVTSELTVEAWIKPASSNTKGRIVDQTVLDLISSSALDGFSLEVVDKSTLRFTTCKKETCDVEWKPSGNGWTHVTAVYSSPDKIMKLYVDGKEAAKVETGAYFPLLRSVSPMRIGSAQNGSNPFTGTIQRVAIFARALKADEIEKRHSAEPAAVPGIIGDWLIGNADVIEPSAGTVRLKRAPVPVSFSGKMDAPAEPLCLWYRRPALQWVEALAIGNGRLGAMIFGGVERERIQLNEDTFWSGEPHDYANPDALASLPEVRKLIFDGQYAEADQLIGKKLLGSPSGQASYQPIGDLSIDFPGETAVKDYRRSLDINSAIATVQYTRDGITFTRELISSPVDQVIAIRFTADRPGRISFSATLATPQRGTVTTEGNDTLVMRGDGPAIRTFSGKLKFECRAKMLTQGGTLAASDSRLVVEKADSAILFLDAGTSFKNFQDVSGGPSEAPRQHIAAAAGKAFDQLLSDHVKEHQRLFQRVQFDLGSTAAAKDPTDERRVNFAKGANDPQLAALYYQFGRYLLISSSRPGSQPPTLQGIWNQSNQPPWSSSYTTNINLEENYWPAESANLGELTEPLFSALKDLSISGQRTAKVMFGARGWVAFHNFDIWRGSAPVFGSVGYSSTCGAWLTTHLWEHYLFSNDKKFLADAYPIMKGSAEFFLDFLVEEPTHHWLVTNPSTSPENRHPPGDTHTCAGSTLDESIIRDLFSQTAQAAEILGVDDSFRKELLQKRERLAPYQIGSAGQLQEWLQDWDMQCTSMTHRHISHLYGLYPSNQISLRNTPDLAKAAIKSLNTRGDNATGWAIAWRINCWARLRDGNRTYKILRALLDPSRTYPNFFDAHPPFQIDGNFAGTAGISEMLLQSQAGEIDLLPALPDAWPTGSISGLRARGGYQVDIRWEEGKLTQVTLRNATGGHAPIRYGDRTAQVDLEPAQPLILNAILSAQK